MRQISFLLVALSLGCAKASPPSSPEATTPPVDAAPATVPDPAAGWSEALQAEAEDLGRRYPDAKVRLLVLDPSTGQVLAKVGPTDTTHATGSTMKTFAAAAALAAGVDPTITLECGEGGVSFDDRTVTDHTVHGTLTLPQAIARSSNVAITRLVQAAGVRATYAEAAKLVPLPDARTVDDATATFLLFGAGTEMTTEELALGYGMLATGGREPGGGAQRLDPAIAASIREMLRGAVELPEGTAEAAAVEGLAIEGKTGTAPHGDGRTALFVGLVPDDDDTPTVVAVVVEGIMPPEHGGTVAAPSFAAIVRRWRAGSG